MVCIVPTVAFTSPARDSRVEEGSSVTIHCNTGYTYGNEALPSIVCSGEEANFPASCRSEH